MLFPVMSARLAIPLLIVAAVIALIAGAVTGVLFLVVFAVLGFIAAAVGGVWVARKARRPGHNETPDGPAPTEPGDRRI